MANTYIPQNPPAMPQPPSPQQPRGYPRVADMMASHSETAIFRRFRSLNLLNLLALQSELQDLETRLSEVRERDEVLAAAALERGDNDHDGYGGQRVKREEFSLNFLKMKNAAQKAEKLDEQAGCGRKEGEDGIDDRYWKESRWRGSQDSEDDGRGDQWRLLLQTRAKLKEYNETLIRLSAVRAIDSPSPQELNGFYQEWLKRPERGNGFLSGSDRYIWRDKSVHEMVTLHRRALDDPFSSFLGSKLINVYHWVRKRLNISKKPIDLDSNVIEYHDASIKRISNVAAVVMSSLIPTLSILVLYFVKRQLVRLGLLIVFTTTFSLTLAWFTEARKVEIFSAVAAFAAVEVVFIGTSGQGPSGQGENLGGMGG